MRIQSLRLDLAAPRRMLWMMAAALLFVLGFEFIRLGLGDALLRLQYNHSVWVVMYAYLTALAWRIGHQEQSRSALWIAGIYLLGTVSILNDLIMMSIGLVHPVPLDSNSTKIVVALTAILAVVISNIAYVGLAFERSQKKAAEADKQYRTIIEATHDELRNSEARFRSYFELPLTGRAITSPSNGWLEVNATLCEMLGYSKTELIQMTWAELTYPEDLAADLVQFNRVMSGEIDGYTLEKRFICKDRHSLHTHLAVHCLRKPDQSVDYFIALIVDITEHKRTEEALRASEELLREMGRIAKVGGWNLDLMTDKLTWTEEIYRIREVDPNYQPKVEEGIDCYAPDARPILRESMERAVTQGVPYDLELPFITAKGNHRWVRTIGKAKRVDGQTVRLYGIFQDITEHKKIGDALKSNEERMRLITDVAPVFLAEVDKELCYRFVNSRYSELFGLSRESFYGQHVREIIGGQAFAKAQPYMLQALTGQPVEFEAELPEETPWGRKTMAVRYAPICDGSAWVTGFVAAITDITERKQVEDTLRESEEKLKALTDSFPLAIYMSAGIAEKAEYANSTFTKLFGYTLDDVPDAAHWWPLAYPEETYRRQIVEEWQRKIEQAIVTRSEIEPMEVVVTCKDGSHKNILWGYKSIGAKNYSYGLDLTARKQAEEEVKKLAFYDPLTQLPNRRLLLDRLQQALATSVRSRLHGALLFIDLDNFKIVNDTLGHDQGDLLLQEVASRLIACVRECDTVARLGGDEFVVMLTGMDGDPEAATAQAKKIGRKILTMLNQVYSLVGHEHYCSASIGITLFFGQSCPTDELLKQADIALYRLSELLQHKKTLSVL